MSRAYLTAAAAALALLAGATDAHAQLPRVNVQGIDLGAPPAAVAGEPMRVRIRAVATGNAVRLRFSWTLYLTVGGVLTGAREIGTLGPVAADAGIVTAAEGTITLPDDMTGSYVVAAVADGLGEIAESNELDNAAVAGNPTRVRPRAADLVLSRVTLSERVRAAGESFGVQITVENRGEEAATADVSARLSVNPVPSRGDPQIGSGTITVAPGQTLTTDIVATVPAQVSAGDYQIGVMIDPELLVEEIDDTNNLMVAADVLNVRSARLALLTPSLPIGNVFMPYRVSFESEGGDGHYRYSITSGVLPRGLVLDGATGLLSGEPRESGKKTLTIEVQSAGLADSKTYELDVRRSVLNLTIATPALDRATVSVAYQVPLLAAGGEPPYTWTLVDGALPPGLDLSTGGSLSGIPIADGSYTFAVQVRDTFGARDQGELTLLVETPNVVVQTTTLPPLKVGEEVSYPLSASGGVPPYEWSMLSTPPPGLTVTELGVVEGTPSQVGSWSMRVRATDSTGAMVKDTALIHVDVEDVGTFEISSLELAPVFIREKFEGVLRAQGGQEPLRWTLVPGDGLPQGFFLKQGETAPLADGTALAPRDAVVVGMSLRPLAHAFSVRVEDAVGRRREAVLAVRILPPDRDSISSGCRCTGTPAQSSGLIVALGALALLGLGRIARRRRAA